VDTGLGRHGVKAFDDVTVVTDSYIHDLNRFASGPNQSGGASQHGAVLTYDLDLTNRENAAFQVTQDGGGRATNLRIEHNWLNGGGCMLNVARKGGPMVDIYVIGNRFGRTPRWTVRF
jgi:hypothetical protein